ncbi:MAG: diacylglycerol kinase family lipid kinase [Kofleriaceae bacterium]|nr:diacylglycerol kinase family lipid kinase [Kofleriaceae bacterium]
MSAPRTVVIVNPRAQGGATGRKWPELAEVVRRRLPFEEVRTEAPGDATRLARAALEAGAEQVVALGGDGTINEVANGFFVDGQPIAPTARLGILPFGTGGDFRRTIAMPREVAAAADVLAAGHTRVIDVGRLTYTTPAGAEATRMFVNICSFGISGLVDQLVNQSSKKLGGRVSFFMATARATWRYSNQRVRLRFDDSRAEADALDLTINTVAVANGRYFGGGMFVAPNAELDDGQFDVVALGDFGFGDLLASGRRIYAGTHLGMDKVTSRRARVVAAEPIDPGAVVELDLDGENVGHLPARFELVPRALTVVVPAPGAGAV